MGLLCLPPKVWYNKIMKTISGGPKPTFNANEVTLAYPVIASENVLAEVLVKTYGIIIILNGLIAYNTTRPCLTNYSTAIMLSIAVSAAEASGTAIVSNCIGELC